MQRRQFLKSAGGIVLGLPFLESLLPKNVKAEEAAPNSFGVFIRHPHGVVHDTWWPTQRGKLSEATMPQDRACFLMRAHAERTMFISGLKMGWGNRNCHHNMHGVQLFTGGEPIFMGDDGQGKALSSHESMEWTIARRLQKPGTEPLVLLAGNRESGIINDTISFRGRGDKATGENDPFAVYKRLFNVSPETASRELMRKSVNDYVLEQIQALQKSPRLSASDKERLDLHFTSVRAVETKISATLPSDRVMKLENYSKMLRNANANNLDQLILLQMEVIALAIASGAVRGVSYQILAGIDGTRFQLDGETLLNSHGASHLEAGLNDADDFKTLRRLDRFWQESIAHLATSLANYKVDNKSLMDYGVIMAATEISDGQSHSENNMPHMLVGSCNGRLKTGEYINLPNISNNQLLATVGAAIGLKKEDGTEITDYGIGRDREGKRTGQVRELFT